MAARFEDALMKKIFPCIFLCKGRSNDDVGVARSTVFQEIRPAAGFKNGDIGKKELGGGVP